MFFAYLGAELRHRGAQVTRLSFCAGDRLYWRTRSGQHVAFRGRPQTYQSFLSKLITQHEITDIICLGDSRFWHTEAISLCKNMENSPKIHVVEHGYYRPGWLTLELGGLNANSGFPRDPHEILQASNGIQLAVTPEYKSSFLRYALLDIGWNLSNIVLSPIFYPHFRSHSLHHPLQEWRGWIAKALRGKTTTKNRTTTLARIARHQGPVFLFPLQLETDSQIRIHGPAGGLRHTVVTTIRSFAKNANPDAMLVFKVHPLDNELTDWRKIITNAAQENSCTNRCVFLNGGDLDALLKRSAGCVTVNSTVGLTAIDFGVPTHVIGQALYRISGLTHTAILDDFWTTPQPPNPELASAFKRLLIHRTQISGAFEGSGVAVGVTNVADRVFGSSRSSSR
ncbi:MAG: capsular biosynthesis protein [Rhodobacteraceae bacterium]|nr:capsular biosynthesis protein [Paracoccaceae bacterium]